MLKSVLIKTKKVTYFTLVVFCSTHTSLPAMLNSQLTKNIYFCINSLF